jgi:hypothetical protein
MPKAVHSAKIWLLTLAWAGAFGLSGPAAAQSTADYPGRPARIAAGGVEPLPSTLEEYAADIIREETKWAAIVKRSGAKAE